MRDSDGDVDQKLKVFISSSGRDLAFADQLVAVFEWQGFQPIRKGIHGAEKWEQRLGQLILESNVVVFVLSPDSAVSDVCARSNAASRSCPCCAARWTASSRISTCATSTTSTSTRSRAFPARASAPARSGSSRRCRSMWRGCESIHGSKSWQRVGMATGALPISWCGARSSPPTKDWRNRRPANAPDLTALQCAFLAASEEEEAKRANTERQRLAEMEPAQTARAKALADAEAALRREAEAQATRARSCRIIQWGGALAALLVVMAALGFAWMQRENAARQRENAVRQEILTKAAEENLRKAQISESRIRAEQAKQTGEDHVTAMLLALEGLPDKAGGVERPFVNEPWHQLYNAHLKQRERAVLEGHRGTVLSAVFAPDGTLILTSSADNTARLWDGDGKPLATLEGHRRGQERGVRARWQAHPYHLGRLYGAAVGWRPQAARHPGRPPARDR